MASRCLFHVYDLVTRMTRNEPGQIEIGMVEGRAGGDS